MRVKKIIPFSVVILLITVSFAGLAAAQSGPTPTQLSAATNLTKVAINTPFTINGTLNDTNGFPVATATIQLQNSTDNTTWNNVTTNVTDANGGYQFSNSESAAGTYYYRTAYAGYSSYFGNATSPVLQVQVNKIPTQLSAAANLPSVAINQSFAINGTLNTTAGTPIAGATIQLQNSTDNTTWNNVTTNVTDANGGYQFSTSESVVGTYQYRTTYAGNDAYANATSPAVQVQVRAPTQLSAAANLPSVAINQSFAINGTLNTTAGTPIAGATIQLQKNVSGTWTDVTGKTNTTTSAGAYSISTSESAAGTYQYRTTFVGDGTYANATSLIATEQVNATPTQLSAATNLTQVAINTPFAINGTLNTTDGTPIAGATIQLQKNVSGTWTNITTNVTDVNGDYQFSQNELTAGTYQYRTTYAGNDTYANATSDVVQVQVNATLTQLSAVTNLTSVAINQNFTINGTLKLNTTDGTPIAGATIQLQKNVSGVWTDVTTNVTDATGGYQFSNNESAAGIHYYRTTYAGYAYIGASTSPVVQVQVNATLTQLSAATNLTSVAINTPFTINGTLNATDGTLIAGATIQLQKNVSGTWTDVTGKTNTTTSAGAYSISTSESVVGSYQYRTTYAGNDTYANTTSPAVIVQVNKIPTQLSAATNLTSVAINTPFTINGTLNATDGTLIAGATIQLQKNVSGTWTDVTGKTNTTTSAGAYSISTSESVVGSYQYRTTYAGYAYIGASTSPVVQVQVNATPTQLSAAANPPSVAINTPFTINGTLNATDGTLIVGATIQLQKNVSGVWTNVTGETNTTTSAGAYSISTSESVVGSYQYRTTYAGNGTYTNATSNVVNVQIKITPASSPAVCAQNANSLDLFVRGTDNALWHKYWTGTTWTTSASLGGNLTSSPAATSRAPGYMDVFVRGTDNALWWKTTTNNGTNWSGWKPVGGQLASGTGPAADARGLNSLDVFVQGTDNGLWYTHWNGATWSAWKSLGKTLTSSPAATSPSTSVIDVFVRGTDNALWSGNSSNNGTSWSGWKSIGGQLASGTGPAADARGLNSLDVFVQGTDNGLWYTHWNGATWSAWGSLGGTLTSSPAATSRSSGTIDVFVLGSDNALWQKTYNNGWSGWTSIAM